MSVTTTPRVDTAGPCEWDVDGCGDCDAYTTLDAETRQMIDDVATALLWNATGRVYGVCDVRVRPCRDDCAAGGSTSTPMRVDGAWVNVAGCGCVNACGCGTAAAQVTVPGPVARVNAIIVDGAALDPSAYRVDNYRHIVRQDGGRWPTCVHMGDPDPGGWTIDYGHGFPVPAGGRFAAGVLACELAKACSGQPCGLPRNVTSIVRQGVTVTRSDLDTLLDAGRFGLFEVDAWVASVQPSMPSHMLAVETPDVQPVRFQTWP